ncbi:XdhC family protein [Vibrio sp. PP-XX7]
MMSSMSWIQALPVVEKSGEAWVLVTVVGTQGSTPREAASKMIITETHSFDTIGGGQLEFAVCQKGADDADGKNVCLSSI